MEGTVAPAMSEESLIYEQRHARLLHGLFLSAPIPVGAVMFLSLLAHAADTMAQHDASFAEVAWVAAWVGLGYSGAAAVVHGAVTSLILHWRPWTVNRVATVHGGVLAVWAVLWVAMTPL